MISDVLILAGAFTLIDSGFQVMMDLRYCNSFAVAVMTSLICFDRRGAWFLD